MNNILLVNTQRLKKEGYLDFNVDDNYIRNSVVQVQAEIIEKVIGTCLYNKLQELICSNEICMPINNLYKELLEENIFYIFKYGVPRELNIPLTLKTRNAGLISVISDNQQIADEKLLKFSNNFYDEKMNFWIIKTINYLKCHYDDIPELKCCSCSWCNERSLQKVVRMPFSDKKFLHGRLNNLNKRYRKW